MTEDTGRERLRGIEVESVVTVDGDCYISSYVADDQVMFLLGPVTNGLILYFDWQGLAKFLGVTAQIVTRVGGALPGKPSEFTISADEQSRCAHRSYVGPL
ncbi:MAG TPA: hypothetical protein VFW65_39895 [Pseudonocardiaceae bacterium]|nr:hypothetical protein [Pseudonocardiaceae bacterium]